MRVFTILFCFGLFCVTQIFCESALVINKYLCSVMDGGYMELTSSLKGQDETSYEVTIDFYERNVVYQTILSLSDFESIEEKLCKSAYVVNVIATDINVGKKDFSTLMSLALDTHLDFYLVEEDHDMQSAKEEEQEEEIIEL
jgi:hypothetical protein